MRERIVAAATELFAARGYDGVSIRDIAAECGITSAALYYHFSGKPDLLRAVITAYLDEVAAVMDAVAATPGDSAVRLRRLLHDLAALPSERGAVLRLALHDLGRLEPAARAAIGDDYERRFVGRIRALLAEGMDAGDLVRHDPTLVTWLLLGMLYPLSSSGRAEGSSSAIDTVCAIALEGLRAPGRPSADPAGATSS